jgi:hypothetical protein
MSDLNLLKKAENVVFRIVDSRLREAKTHHTDEGFLMPYDVICVWSVQVGEQWKGAFNTTVDKVIYQVTYNADTKIAQVVALEMSAEYFFPDGETTPLEEKEFWN